MTRALVHATLLGAMLIAAFATWTAKESADTDHTTVAVWSHDPEDVTAVTYRAANRRIELQRRGSGDAAYLWAIETDSARPVPGDTGAASRSAALQTTEYPVGEEGETIVQSLARLRAIRDLGEATPEKRKTYGFSDSVATLTMRLRNRTERALALGTTVLGGGSRYVQDLRRGRIYVVPVTLVRPFELGGDMLRLTRMQTFEPDDVAKVTVRAANAERTMRRRTQGAPPEPVWSPPDADRPDDAFGNFMNQIDQLWISRFVPAAAADTLQSIVRVDYFDNDNDALGFLELFRTRASTGTPAYLMRTGRTIVFGEVYAPLAERIEQDAAALFGRQSSGSDQRDRSPR